MEIAVGLGPGAARIPVGLVIVPVGADGLREAGICECRLFRAIDYRLCRDGIRPVTPIGSSHADLEGVAGRPPRFAPEAEPIYLAQPVLAAHAFLPAFIRSLRSARKPNRQRIGKRCVDESL